MTVTFHTIQHFSIELPHFEAPQFLNSWETFHSANITCKIALFDGRESCITLSEEAIHTLITRLRQRQITNPLGDDYFDRFREIPLKKLNKILSGIFEQ